MRLKVTNLINIYPTLKKFLLGMWSVENAPSIGMFQVMEDVFDSNPMHGIRSGIN
jgi:hypothetical protein